MRMDQIIRTSGQVLTDDLDWEEGFRVSVHATVGDVMPERHSSGMPQRRVTEAPSGP